MNAAMRDPNRLYCSFCAKAHDEVTVLIAGPATFICDECVALSVVIVRSFGSHEFAVPADFGLTESGELLP